MKLLSLRKLTYPVFLSLSVLGFPNCHAETFSMDGIVRLENLLLPQMGVVSQRRRDWGKLKLHLWCLDLLTH